MDKKTLLAPVPPLPREKQRVESKQLKKRLALRTMRHWLILLVGGSLLIGGSALVFSVARNVQISVKHPPAPMGAATLPVHRTVSYADLAMTVIEAQAADSFPEDPIHADAAVVRLKMHVANPTQNLISVVYYDCTHLLLPHASPIAPTLVSLPTMVKPGASETGWIDFPIPRASKLSTVVLQLGSTQQNEQLVKVPLSGPFAPTTYANRSVVQQTDLSYAFRNTVLLYHLNSIDVRFSYSGREVKSGQQFYVFNFLVGNESGEDVTTGFAFDYVRLALNGENRSPLESDLPETFHPSAHAASGQVVFAAPAGLKTLTLVFLPQFGGDNQIYTLTV